MTSPSKKYTLGQLAEVRRSILELSEVAKKAGKLQRFLTTLKEIAFHLETNPNEWGDPTYHPKKSGSVVRHRAYFGVTVRYVVYENENSVLVLQFRPMPNTYLAGGSR